MAEARAWSTTNAASSSLRGSLFGDSVAINGRLVCAHGLQKDRCNDCLSKPKRPVPVAPTAAADPTPSAPAPAEEPRPTASAAAGAWMASPMQNVWAHDSSAALPLATADDEIDERVIPTITNLNDEMELMNASQNAVAMCKDEIQRIDAESKHKLSDVMARIGPNNIAKAKHYHDALAAQHDHKSQLQEVALRIDAATSLIGSTKVVVQALEDQLLSRCSEHGLMGEVAEQLNDATLKLRRTQAELKQHELDFKSGQALLAESEEAVGKLAKSVGKKKLDKTAEFFELSSSFERKRQASERKLKMNLQDYEAHRLRYVSALRKLERIGCEDLDPPKTMSGTERHQANSAPHTNGQDTEFRRETI